MSDALTAEKVRDWFQAAVLRYHNSHGDWRADAEQLAAVCESWLAQDAELVALRAKINAALALPENLKRIGFESIDGWRVVEAMRETLIGG